MAAGDVLRKVHAECADSQSGGLRRVKPKGETDRTADGGQGMRFSLDTRKGDAYIELRVSDDGMVATADLFPPLGEGQGLSTDYAWTLLSRLGIVAGVDREALESAVLWVNLERKPRMGVTVARGTAPTPQRPERVAPLPCFAQGFTPVDDKLLNVDWKALSPFTMVAAGEEIATVEPAMQGTPGQTVRGEPLPFAVEPVQAFSLGKNVERQDDRVVALAAGRLLMDSNRLQVEDVLVVAGDVDYRVGHIMFPGDVSIQGSVGDGFKVYSGGSIAIQQTMDAYDVSAKKDLFCAQGLIGKDPGQVRVGGSLKAKFVENARLAVRGDAVIPGSIIGSTLYVLGRLDMGDKGRIVGGETWATHGVRCGWIGGASHPRTLVNAGIDFVMQQKLDRANAGVMQLAEQLARLDGVLKARPSEAYARQREALAAKLAALLASVEELAKLVDIDEGATVEARLGVHPGTVISICHISVSIDQPMKKARFSLNRAANKITLES